MPRKWSLFRVWVGGVPLEARSHARHLGRGHLWAAAHRFGRLGSSFAPKFGIPRICKVVTGWRLPGWLPLSAAPAATLAAAAATLAADFHPPAATPRRPGSHLAGSRQPPRPPWLPGWPGWQPPWLRWQPPRQPSGCQFRPGGSHFLLPLTGWLPPRPPGCHIGSLGRGLPDICHDRVGPGKEAEGQLQDGGEDGRTGHRHHLGCQDGAGDGRD